MKQLYLVLMLSSACGMYAMQAHKAAISPADKIEIFKKAENVLKKGGKARGKLIWSDLEDSIQDLEKIIRHDENSTDRSKAQVLVLLAKFLKIELTEKDLGVLGGIEIEVLKEYEGTFKAFVFPRATYQIGKEFPDKAHVLNALKGLTITLKASTLNALIGLTIILKVSTDVETRKTASDMRDRLFARASRIRKATVQVRHRRTFEQNMWNIGESFNEGALTLVSSCISSL